MSRTHDEQNELLLHSYPGVTYFFRFHTQVQWDCLECAQPELISIDSLHFYAQTPGNLTRIYQFGTLETPDGRTAQTVQPFVYG